MNDMSKVIEPRSDQLNSDDLLTGQRTITIRDVTIRPGTEQPVSVFFEGDNNKPWKLCKSMSRVLVHAWGADASKYIGRSVTLYCDPRVKWGGMQVGGIRVSHLSHIDRDMVMALTETKGKKAPFVVKPLTAKQTASGAKPEQKTPAPPAGPGTSSAAYTGSEPVYEVRNAFGEITEMLNGPLYLVAMDKFWNDAATSQNEQELLAIYEQNAGTIDELPDDLKQALRDSYKRHKQTFGGKKK